MAHSPDAKDACQVGHHGRGAKGLLLALGLDRGVHLAGRLVTSRARSLVGFPPMA